MPSPFWSSPRPVGPALAGGLIGAGTCTAAAGTPVIGPYVGLGAGIDLQQDETLKPIAALEPKC